MAPRFKLNILWLENELGIAIDQIQAGEQIPLTDYFFWPKSDFFGQKSNFFIKKLPFLRPMG